MFFIKEYKKKGNINFKGFYVFKFTNNNKIVVNDRIFKLTLFMVYKYFMFTTIYVYRPIFSLCKKKVKKSKDSMDLDSMDLDSMDLDSMDLDYLDSLDLHK